MNECFGDEKNDFEIVCRSIVAFKSQFEFCFSFFFFQIQVKDIFCFAEVFLRKSHFWSGEERLQDEDGTSCKETENCTEVLFNFS